MPRIEPWSGLDVEREFAARLENAASVHAASPRDAYGRLPYELPPSAIDLLARDRRLSSAQAAGTYLRACARLVADPSLHWTRFAEISRGIRTLRRRQVALPHGYPAAPFLEACPLADETVVYRLAQVLHADPRWDVAQIRALVEAAGRRSDVTLARVLRCEAVPLDLAIQAYLERPRLKVRRVLAQRSEAKTSLRLRRLLAADTKDCRTLRSLIAAAPPEEASEYLGRMVQQNMPRAIAALDEVAPDGLMLRPEEAEALLQAPASADRSRAILGMRRVAAVAERQNAPRSDEAPPLGGRRRPARARQP